uniref:Uncharacterized protein n=1 Tax=Arundo donax TaxID=35708 RepID=A0A0A9CE30_ARUDO
MEEWCAGVYFVINNSSVISTSEYSSPFELHSCFVLHCVL